MNKRKFKIEKLKSLIGLVMVAVGLITDAGIGIHLYQHKAPQTAQTVSLDTKIRSSIVKLSSPLGSCSGEEIKAPSGKEYILSAKHCTELALSGMMVATREDGGFKIVKILATSDSADLILLSPMEGVPTLPIAFQVMKYQPVHVFGHCHGRSTSRADGVMLEDIVVQPSLLPDAVDPNGVMMSFSIVSVSPCAGTSGGSLIDDSGSLVGVVSMGDGNLGYFVRLADILSFLSDK